MHYWEKGYIEATRQIAAHMLLSFLSLDQKMANLHVFVQMHRLIVDVVLQEEVVNTGQEGHLRQGEYVHELLHGVAVGTLQDTLATFIFSCLRFRAFYRQHVMEETISTLP